MINNPEQIKILDSLLQELLAQVDSLKGNQKAVLSKWIIDVNLAGTKEIALLGNFIYAIEATDGEAVINVRFNANNVSPSAVYSLSKGLGYRYPYEKIFLDWTAQTGKTITLLIGNVSPTLIDIIDNRSGVLQTTLLEAIRDELLGDVVAEGFNLVNLDAQPHLIITSNTDRKSVIIQALYGNATDIYIGYDNTVASTKFVVRLRPGEIFSVDDYRGDIWAYPITLNDDVSYGEV